MTPTAYPLQWPPGWPREANRLVARFKTTLPAALANLQNQLKLMNCEAVVLSSNYTLGAANPKDPGVVAYFTWVETRNPRKEIQMAIPCDRWAHIEDNVHAIALTVEAMRGMERWGAKHMIRAMFTGFKALPAGNGESWQTVLGVRYGCNLDEVKIAYRELAKRHHPDNGGNAEAFRRVQEAYETALRSL